MATRPRASGSGGARGERAAPGDRASATAQPSPIGHRHGCASAIWPRARCATATPRSTVEGKPRPLSYTRVLPKQQQPRVLSLRIGHLGISHPANMGRSRSLCTSCRNTVGPSITTHTHLRRTAINSLRIRQWIASWEVFPQPNFPSLFTIEPIAQSSLPEREEGCIRII